MKLSRIIKVALIVGVALLMIDMLVKTIDTENGNTNWVTIILVAFLALLYFMTMRSRKRFDDNFIDPNDSDETH